MRTLALDLTNWDLFTDSSGNIAVAEDPYAISQSVASACRVFLGDLWYNQSVGIPYFQTILGKPLSATYLKAQIAAAAASVPGCYNPIVYLSAMTGRTLAGQVQFTDAAGNQQVSVISQTVPAVNSTTVTPWNVGMPGMGFDPTAYAAWVSGLPHTPPSGGGQFWNNAGTATQT